MLDHLAGEDASQAGVGNPFQVGERVGLLDLDTLAAGVGDHVGVGVDSARLDPGVAEEAEQLAATAADVEHRSSVAEVLDVGTLTLADVSGRAAHLRFEGEVVGDGGRGRLGGDRRGARAGAAPLDARQPFLQLAERPHCFLPRPLAAVDLLEDPVDQLQHDVVEHALLGRERLDVPAEERPKQLLDRVRDPALEPRPPFERPVGRHGPEPLGAVSRGQQLPPALPGAVRPARELLAKPCDERLDIDLRGRRNPC